MFKKEQSLGGKVFMFFRLPKPLFFLSDVCNNAVIVISGMDLALRASSYAHSMPLIAITALLQASKRKNSGLESLENGLD